MRFINAFVLNSIVLLFACSLAPAVDAHSKHQMTSTSIHKTGQQKNTKSTPVSDKKNMSKGCTAFDPRCKTLN